eukprot:gene3995-biopygen2322
MDPVCPFWKRRSKAPGRPPPKVGCAVACPVLDALQSHAPCVVVDEHCPQRLAWGAVGRELRRGDIHVAPPRRRPSLARRPRPLAGHARPLARHPRPLPRRARPLARHPRPPARRARPLACHPRPLARRARPPQTPSAPSLWRRGWPPAEDVYKKSPGPGRP